MQKMFFTNKNNNLLFLLSVLAMSVWDIKPTIALDNCPTPFEIGQRCTDSALIEVSKGPNEGGTDRKTISIEPTDGWIYVPGSIRVEKTKNNESPSNISYQPLAAGNSFVSTSTLNNAKRTLERAFSESIGKAKASNGTASVEAITKVYAEFKRELEDSQRLVEQMATENARIQITAETRRKCTKTLFGECLDYVGRYAGWKVYADFVYVGTNQEINNITQKATQEMLALASIPQETTYSLICIKNSTNIDLPYRGKWSTDSGWFDVTLKPGESWRHWRENSNATMSIKFDSDARNGQVDTKTYTLQANISNDTKCSSGKPYRYKYTNSSREYIDLYKD